MFTLQEINKGEKRKFQLMCAVVASSRNIDAILNMALQAELIYTVALPRNRTAFNITAKGKKLVEVWYS